MSVLAIVRIICLCIGILGLTACGAASDTANEPSRVGSSEAVASASTQVPTPIPTPTPDPDSDDDGLTDIQERELGTNPFQRDSDVDGLDDGAEVRLGSNPLFPDTDRDGVVDGDDTDPLNDLAVELTLLEFIDRTDRAILALFDGIDAYLLLSVDEQQIKIPVDYFTPVAFNVPDTLSKVRVSVRGYETEGGLDAIARQLLNDFVQVLEFSEPPDDPYDLSSSRGTPILTREIELKVGGSSIPNLVGNGLDDGRLDDPTRYQAEIAVRIRVGAFQKASEP